jgi:hypothetical protein
MDIRTIGIKYLAGVKGLPLLQRVQMGSWDLPSVLYHRQDEYFPAGEATGAES